MRIAEDQQLVMSTTVRWTQRSAVERVKNGRLIMNITIYQRTTVETPTGDRLHGAIQQTQINILSCVIFLFVVSIGKIVTTIQKIQNVFRLQIIEFLATMVLW